MTVVRWCKEHSLAEGERQTKEVAGRTMTVLRTRGVVHALDSACFHMGGPVGQLGDIEDYNGTPCIRCPSHNYRINLTTGGHVERDLQGRACEHAGKQRIHRVILDDGWIWVEVAGMHPPCASDKYNVVASGGGVNKQGYGLAASMQPPSTSPWPEAMESSQPPEPISTPPQPLVPFAGVDKRALPPSPLKAPQAQLSFRGQKHTAMGVRGELARQAVLLNAKPPPMASITMNLTTPARSEALAPAHGRAVQRSLKDFFGATAVAAVGGGATSHASDMEF